MLPKTESYGLWPASGEIDIMESRGNVNPTILAYNDRSTNFNRETNSCDFLSHMKITRMSFSKLLYIDLRRIWVMLHIIKRKMHAGLLHSISKPEMMGQF